MSQITLEEIKQTQATLNKMIAQFEASKVVQDMFPINIGMPHLNPGEKWVAVVINADGSKKEHIILLPGEMDDIKWDDAMKWAESIGGHLPDRVEQALLFKCLKDEFEEEAYWSCEQSTSSAEWAWFQSFSYGHQNCNFKTDALRARAVRRELVI